MKRYILCAAVCLFLCGCNESTSNEDACDTATFQPSCLSEGTYLACINGTAMKGVCNTGMHCVQGICVSGCTQHCETNVLVSCINGSETRTVCPNGCENNACRTAPAVCSPEGRRCDGNALVTCSGGIESRAICPNGCEGNACKTVPTACTPDGIRCDGNALVTCTGGVESRENCTNGCENNACKTVPTACTPDGVRCDGNALVTCTGGIESRENCTNGCENNACKTVQTACTPDSVRCDGNTLVTCTGGVESRENCLNGCENNACKTVPAGCSPDGVRCDGNALVTCSSGVESRETCPNGCQNNACIEPNDSCGNDIREGSELCDGKDLGKLTCHDVEGSKPSIKYVGKPECSSTCDGLTMGTCEESLCSNNKLDINAQEFCDIVNGEAKFLNEPKCEDLPGYDGKTWQKGGKPGCSDDCKSLQKGSCKLASQPQGGIEKCQFVDLEQNDTTKEVTGHALLTPIEGVTQTMIKGRLACGNPSVATYSWKREDARFMECEQCAENEYKLVSEISYADKPGGTYGCVFQIYVNTKDIDGSNSTSYYNCPIEMGYPFAEGIPTDEIMRTFEVEGETVEGTVLAHWDFSNYKKDDKTKSASANDGVFASSSSISLSDGSQIRMLTGTGDYPEGAASGDKWSTDASLTDLDNTKHFVLTSKSTGYKNVRFQFMVAGSGISEKPIAVAYRLGNTAHLTGEVLKFSDTNKFHDYPLTIVNELSNQEKFELDVYTYGATDPNMTIRLDDIYLIGDPE